MLPFVKKRVFYLTVLLFAGMITFIGIFTARSVDESLSYTDEEENSILIATNTRALRDVTFQSSPERLKRGSYLANGILKCFYCHSPRDSSRAGFPPIEEKKGAGEILWETASSRMVAPNITPDVETGAGKWTDDMFARAIREGIGHDGRALSLPMYWSSFRDLSDEDLASVVVYLKSIPPVRNKLPKRRLSPEREAALQATPAPLTQPVEAPDNSDMLSRGKYLVKVANCAGCHTSWYKRNPGIFGGGNIISTEPNGRNIFSTNLTPDATGLGGWTPETFINVIRSGKEGALHASMPWVSYRNISDDDLTAIFMALQNLPPANHRVINLQEPTYCEVCEQEHGFGTSNKIKPFTEVPFDKSLYPDLAGVYVHPMGFQTEVKLNEGKLLISEGGDFMELVHIGEGRFLASGLSTPVSFKRDPSGKVKWMISYWIEEDVFEKRNESEDNL